MRGPHPQSHVVLQFCSQLCSYVTNQKYFTFNFTWHRVHKLSRMMTRMKRPHLTYQVPPRSYCHVTIIQYVVYICSTSSWSFLLKTDRFQMIMTTLKMCSLFKEKYPDWESGSVSGIICFLVYMKSVPSRQTRHRFITIWEKQVRLLV